MIQLTNQPIDSTALLAKASRPEAGAVVLFLGTTRELTDGRQTVALDYEAYDEMAEKKLAELEAEARRRWPLVECIIVHRLGRVPLAEASVAIVVSTPHRADAFAAGQWLIDSLKHDVPIWKREHWADGTSEWVHPATGEQISRVARDTRQNRHRDLDINHQHVAPHRPPRPRAPQPADQRHRSLQHPLLLLHAERERPLQAAARNPVVRGDHAVRARRRRRWACGGCGSPAASRSCGPILPQLVEQLAATAATSTTSP